MLLEHSESDGAFDLKITSLTENDLQNPRRNDWGNAKLAERHLKLGVKPLEQLLGEVVVKGRGKSLVGKIQLGRVRSKADDCWPALCASDEGRNIFIVASDHAHSLFMLHCELSSLDLLDLAVENAPCGRPRRAKAAREYYLHRCVLHE